MQPLPRSLMAIRVFDAAAKHMSCSRAADELFLTQSAVSKQLQSLENYLGVKLFKRVHQGLTLTDAGTVYLQAVRPALSLLADATAKARTFEADRSTIYLGLPATFGQKWLIQRIAGFTRRHSDIVVQFAPKPMAKPEEPTFTAEIRAGRGTWEGMHAQYLMGRELYVICNPAMARKLSTRRPEHLLDFRLLEHVRLPQMWARWFSAHRVSGYDGENTQRYERFSIMISALSAGLGIGLMPRCLIEQELSSGELTLLFDEPLKTEYGYYFVHPKELYPTPAIRLFSDWLMEKCAESRAAMLASARI